jgi:hypothetical protein
MLPQYKIEAVKFHAFLGKNAHFTFKKQFYSTLKFLYELSIFIGFYYVLKLYQLDLLSL